MKISIIIASLFAALVPCPAAPLFPPGSVPTLGYVLQAENLAGDRAGVVRKLAGCERDVIVIDADFSADSPWTRDEIAAIRSGRKDRRIFAYLSIGEAENYRGYWQSTWSTKPPGWLGKENSDWPGNFRVNYWDPGWQAHILAALDRIVGAGFDGVYLDIVDAFEGFEHDPQTGQWRDHLENPATGQSYRKDMIAWVRRIADTARKKNPRFAVIPQNGVQLLEDPQFVEVVDAMGVEDLFANDGKPASKDESAHRLGCLRHIHPKPVFVIEYDLEKNALRTVLKQCEEQGFSLLVTNRALDSLGSAFAPPENNKGTFSSMERVRVEASRLMAGDRPVILNGVNVNAYSDDEGDPVDETLALTSENDYKKIAAAGLNCVRLNLWAKAFDAGDGWLKNSKTSFSAFRKSTMSP